jgi:hypothetical protein
VFTGTGKDFLERYSQFEKRYQSELLKNLDVGKAQGVDLDFIMNGGAINLDILNAEAKTMLEREYREDVLRLPKMFRDIGNPGIQMPSSNRYRYAFRYGVDTEERIIESSSSCFE